MEREYESVGRLNLRRRVGAFHLARTDYEPPLRTARHSHEPASFTFVLRGHYQERVAGLAQEHRAGTLIHKPAGEPHANRFDGRASTLIVQFPGGRRWRERLKAPLLGETFELEGPDLLRLGAKLLGELEAGLACADLAIECLLFELIHRASAERGRRFPTAPTARTRLARDWLHAHVGDRLDLTRIASELGVSPSHLSRAFRRAFGCTLGEYQRQLRVGRVLDGIRRGRGSLAGLAQEAGFTDQSHMNRVFKRHLGITPGVYRRVRCDRAPGCFSRCSDSMP